MSLFHPILVADQLRLVECNVEDLRALVANACIVINANGIFVSNEIDRRRVIELRHATATKRVEMEDSSHNSYRWNVSTFSKKNTAQSFASGFEFSYEFGKFTNWMLRVKAYAIGPKLIGGGARAFNPAHTCAWWVSIVVHSLLRRLHHPWWSVFSARGQWMIFQESVAVHVIPDLTRVAIWRSDPLTLVVVAPRRFSISTFVLEWLFLCLATRPNNNSWFVAFDNISSKGMAVRQRAKASNGTIDWIQTGIGQLARSAPGIDCAVTFASC